MDLPKSIVKEFAKQAVEKKPTVDKPTQLVGTVQVEDGQTFVYLDGSNENKTPVSETVAYQSGDRVLVSIQNRKATIIGNYTDPSINQALDDVIVEYALSSSSVSFIAWPGEKGEWNTIAPEKEDGSYMWQRTTKISTNPLVNPEISLTCIQGSDGEDGYTPYIGSNGNWWINGVDTGYSAEGDDGHSPYVNTTTNTWWEWDADIGNYHDTGIVPQGPGVFKSIVFKRFSSEPSTPTGGSYLSPVPSGWSDGIPSGTEQIWISTRVFTSDGESPQTSEWTTPQMASDTPDIDFEYSWIVTNPGNPTDNPGNWSNAATENSIWMAVRKKSMGAWSSWEIIKIKGEDGEDGRGISSTVVSYAKSDDGNTAPTSGWEDRIPPLTDSEPYLWTKTHIVYTSGSPAYTDIFTVSKKGETGAIGTGISNITEEWARGTDSTADSSSWGTSQPTLTTTYPVLWYRLKIEWVNPSSTTYAPSSEGQKSTMINELVAFRNLIANDGYTTINGSKIGSGTITLGGTANGDGLLEVYDSLNILVAKLSKDENIFAGFKVKTGYGILGFGDTGDLQRSFFSLQHEWIGWQYYFEEVPSIQFAQHTFGNEKFFDSVDGWYQSNNKGYANTAAMEEIKLQISSPTHVYMDVVDCSNNTVNDYGTVSIIGGTLDETSTYSSISGDVKWTGYNNHKVGGETIDFGIVQPGVHHIMLRYKKGSSAAYENDRLYFRLYTGKEPALFYEDEAGSLMYVSKTRLYQRRIEATYDDPNNPEFISYSCYKTLIRNASMDVEMSDSDYVPINEPEIPIQRRISKTNIGGGFIDFTFNNGSTRLGYEDVKHTLYTDANICIEDGSGITVTGLAGEIKMWAGDAIPDGWLLCDGSEVSKTDYPYLYSAIGDLWGTPSSSSNFKLPNLTGRVPVGYNSADTDTTETFGKVGATGGARGAWYHTHTIGSSGAHSHASQGRMEGSGTGANIFESYNGASKTRSVNVPRNGTNGAHTHSPGSSGSSGNKLAVDKANMPPYAVVKYIICAF